MAKPENRPKISIHSPQSDQERERIYSFRYRTLVERQGGSSVYADHDKKFIKDDLDDSAFHLFLMANGAVVASVRVNSAASTQFPARDVKNFQFEKFSEFGSGALSMTSRLVMAGGALQSKMAAVLLGAAYKIVRNKGSRFDFASCTPSLMGLYEMLGYRRFGDNFEDEDGVYQVPLCLVTEDEQYLRDVQSPFARLCGEFHNTVETGQWFPRAFPEYASSAGDHAMDEERFWEFLTEKMQQTPLERIPLLKGLSYNEAKKILRAGTVLECKPGDQIVQAGQMGREMFVLLSGDVEVTAHGSTVAELSSGAIFGEAALISEVPRTANVVARNDVEVLIVTQDVLKKSMGSMPEIMVKVLFNLAMILSERLQEQTARIAGGEAQA